MRPRIALLCSALTALAVLAAPGFAGAAPKHNRGLTISATPNPIISGEGVLIYGQLMGSDPSGRTIVLYHHISGSHQGYTKIGRTTTDSHGFYEFTRAEGVVLTNRSWFTREAGAPGVHSRTVHERVAALVGARADTTSALTRQPVTFSGHVSPDHAFQRILLQQQVGASDDWRTLKAGRLGPRSSYSIVYRWGIPGDHAVRVRFAGDVRNTAGVSDPITVSIQQAQVADFTINTSAPVITYGQSATISGKLYARGTTTPAPRTAVTLCHRRSSEIIVVCDAAGITGIDGSYGFTISPTRNEVYYVKTALPPKRRTAGLIEGVRDIVKLSADSSKPTAGQKVTFTGTVTPDKAGGLVYLQRLGADGDWHAVGVARVRSGSTFAFTRVFGNAGAKTFRARVPGDEANVGAASDPVKITVSLPPVASLPPGS